MEVRSRGFQEQIEKQSDRQHWGGGVSGSGINVEVPEPAGNWHTWLEPDQVGVYGEEWSLRQWQQLGGALQIAPQTEFP